MRYRFKIFFRKGLRLLLSFSSVLFLFVSVLCVSAVPGVTDLTISHSFPTLDNSSFYLEASTSTYETFSVWGRFVVEDPNDSKGSVLYPSGFGFTIDYISSSNSFKISAQNTTFNASQNVGFFYYICDLKSNTFEYYYVDWWNQSYIIIPLSKYGGTISGINLYNLVSVNDVLSGGVTSFNYIYGSDVSFWNELNVVSMYVSTISYRLSLVNQDLSTLINMFVPFSNDWSTISSQIDGIYSFNSQQTEFLRAIYSDLVKSSNADFYNPDSNGDKTFINGVRDTEAQVVGDTSYGQSEASKSLSGFALLFDTQDAIYKGTLAITKVFNVFSDSPYLQPILNFSLVLGICAFVIGTTFIVVRSFSKK